MCLRVPITNPSCQLWSLSVGKCEMMMEQCGKYQSSQAQHHKLSLLCFLLFSWLIFTFIWTCRELSQLCETLENTSLTAFVFCQLPSKLHKHQRQHSRDKILQLQLRGSWVCGSISLDWVRLEASILESGWKGIAAVIHLALPRSLVGMGGLFLTCRLENFPTAPKSKVSMGGTGRDQEKEKRKEGLEPPCLVQL